MMDKDPAFLWETEALRDAPQRATEEEIDDVDTTPERWVTLRVASRSTGIPVETLRKWARRGTIPTYLQPTNIGTNLRLVDLEGVEQRAADLGRPVEPESVPAPEAKALSADPDSAPAGTMIVPVDAWNKMLSQLGNLHEAGQQLADARERAAKAETEAKFLRERLAELRSDLGELTAAPPQPEAQPETPPKAPPKAPSQAAKPAAVESPPAPPEKVWHYLIRRVRDRRSG